MKLFTVIAEFWRNGILQPIGDVIGMTEAEAKYLMHALEEKAMEEIAVIENGVAQVVTDAEDLFSGKKAKATSDKANG